MNKHQKELLLSSVLLAIAVAALIINLDIQNQEPEIVENGTIAAHNSEALDFQGETDRTKITDNGLEIDTYTELEKQDLTNASKVLAATATNIYFRDKGSTYSFQDGKREKLRFDATYGAVAGNFKHYNGFNLVYSDSNRDVHVRNLETDSDRILKNMKAVEISKTDADNDGISEAGEIKLINGSTLILEPETKDSRLDIDQDGLEERVNLKNGQIVLYDTKHGQKELTAANSYVIQEKTLFVTANNQLSKLELKQKYHDSGTYVSKTIQKEGEIAQIVVYSELNNGKASLTTISSEKRETYQLENGYTDIKPSKEFSNITRIKISLQTANPEKTPLVKNYRIITQ